MGAFITVYVIFSITIILAYFRFGPGISEDFLEDIENSISGYMVKASAILVCMFVAPLCVLPITDDIELWINTYRLKKRTTQQETFGTKDIDAVDAAVQGQNENASGMTDQKKNLMFDI